MKPAERGGGGGGGFGPELAAAMPEPSPMADGLIDEAHQAAAATASPAAPGAMPADGSAPPVDPAAAASDTAELVFTLAPAMLGPEWEPAPDERERCTRALRRYYEKYGSFDLPPGWALIAAFGIYAGKRLRGSFLPLLAKLGLAPAPLAVADTDDAGEPAAGDVDQGDPLTGLGGGLQHGKAA